MRIPVRHPVEIGRVNQILKRGMKNVDLLQVSHEIAESRWLAGVWYARLAMPERMVTALHDTKPLMMEILRTHKIHDMSSLIRAGEILHVLEDVLLEGTPATEAHRRVLYVELLAELKTIGRIDTPKWRDTLDHFYNRHMEHRYKSPLSPSVLWHLVDLAMVDYRMKNRMSRTTRRWQFSGYKTDDPDDFYRHINVVCSYCGIRLHERTLETDGISERDYTRQTNDHTLTCALWFLMHDERVTIVGGKHMSPGPHLERVGPNTALGEQHHRDHQSVSYSRSAS